MSSSRPIPAGAVTDEEARNFGTIPGTEMVPLLGVTPGHKKIRFPSPFYLNPPTDSPAVFSTNFGAQPYRVATATVVGRSSVPHDIIAYSEYLRDKYPDATRTLEPFTRLEDIHKYFDMYDIWSQGLSFLWEVITEIDRTNRCIPVTCKALVDRWLERPGILESFKTFPADVDVIDSGLLTPWDRWFLDLRVLKPWQMQMLREALNAARLALEPALQAEREAAEVERLRKEEEARVELERAERERLAAAEAAEKAAQEAAEKAETLRQEAEALRQKAEEESEAARRQASRERNERFDRSQAQNRAASGNQWQNQAGPLMNAPQMGKCLPSPVNISKLTVLGRYGESFPQFNPNHAAYGFQGAEVYGSGYRQDAQAVPMQSYGPQTPYNSHRLASQPLFVHDPQRPSVGFRNEHAQEEGFHNPDRNFHGANTGAHGFAPGRNGRGRQSSAQSSGPWSQQESQEFLQRRQEEATRQAFIAGFGDANELYLTALMSECGEVVNVRIKHNYVGYQSHAPAYGFVTFAEEESVEKAIERWNGNSINTSTGSWKLRVGHPRYSPKHPEFVPDFPGNLDNRGRQGRRDSNASSQTQRNAPPMPSDRARGSDSGVHNTAQGSTGKGDTEHAIGATVSDENVRPGSTAKPNKNPVSQSVAVSNVEPLSVRRPNVGAEGLTINVPAAMALKSNAADDPLQASTPVTTSSTGVQPEAGSSQSTPKNQGKKKAGSKKKKGQSAATATSQDPPVPEASGTNSKLGAGESAKTSSVSEKPATVDSKLPLSQARPVDDKQKLSVPDVRHNAKHDVAIKQEDLGTGSVQDESSATAAKGTGLKVKKTRKSKTPSSLGPNEEDKVSGSLEEDGPSARATSNFQGREKDKVKGQRSQSASPSFRSPQMSEKEAVPEVVEPVKKPEGLVGSLPQTPTVNVFEAPTEKDGAAKASTPVKNTRLPIIALPLPVEKLAVSPKVNTDSAQLPAASSSATQAKATTSWAEEVQDSAETVEAVPAMPAKAHDLQEQTSGSMPPKMPAENQNKGKNVESIVSEAHVGTSSSVTPAQPVEQSTKEKNVKGHSLPEQTGGTGKKKHSKKSAAQQNKEKTAKGLNSSEQAGTSAQPSSSKTVEKAKEDKNVKGLELEPPIATRSKEVASSMEAAPPKPVAPSKDAASSKEVSSKEAASSKEVSSSKEVAPPKEIASSKDAASSKEVASLKEVAPNKDVAPSKETAPSKKVAETPVIAKIAKAEDLPEQSASSGKPLSKKPDDSKMGPQATGKNVKASRSDIEKKPFDNKGKGRATTKAVNDNTEDSTARVKNESEHAPSANIKGKGKAKEVIDSSVVTAPSPSIKDKGKAKEVVDSSVDTAPSPSIKDKGKAKEVVDSSVDTAPSPSIKDKGKAKEVVDSSVDTAPSPSIKDKGKAKEVVDSSVDTDESNTAFYQNETTETGFTSYVESTPKSAQRLQQHRRGNDSISSDTATISSVDPKTHKGPAFTEPLSIFKRATKVKHKNKKKSKTPVKASGSSSIVGESVGESMEQKGDEQKVLEAEAERASKIPLPNTPKPGEDGTAKGKSLSGLTAGLLHTPLGRTSIFAAAVLIVAAVFVRGVSGGGESTNVVCMAKCGGVSGGSFGAQFHGSQSVSYTFHGAMEGAVKDE